MIIKNKRNKIIEGKLLIAESDPGNNMTNNINYPIGYLRTECTGCLEFMYFKDYEIKNNQVIFKTFEEEFLNEEKGRNADTIYQFHSAFLRIPEELEFITIKKEETGNIIEIESTVLTHSGIALLNIHKKGDLGSSCAKAYFEFTRHYETSDDKRFPSPFLLKSYPYIYPPVSEKTINKDQPILIEEIIVRSGNPSHGCTAFAYIGDNKPILFKLTQNRDKDILNPDLLTSYLILGINMDHSIVFAEVPTKVNGNQRPVPPTSNHVGASKHQKIILDVSHIMEHHPVNAENKKLGIKNLQPVVYAPRRVEKNFGIHILLNADYGWTTGYYELGNY